MADLDKGFKEIPLEHHKLDEGFHEVPITEEPQGPTNWQSAGAGFKQGATLGFGDELGAGVQAGAQALGLGQDAATQEKLKEMEAQGFTGKDGESLNPSILDTYRQARGENRAENAALQKANPRSYLLGNIAGGIAPGVVGGGLVGRGATSLANKIPAGSTLAKLGEFGSALASKYPRLANIGKVAAVSGGAGGVGGLGSSEADLTQGQFEQAASDVGTGAKEGMAMGALLGTAGQGFGMLKDLVKRGIAPYKQGKMMLRSHELGTQGRGIASEEDIGSLGQPSIDLAQELTDKVLNNIKNSSELRDAALKGKMVDPTKFLQDALKQVDAAVKSSHLDPSKAEGIKQVIRQNLYEELPNEIKRIETQINGTLGKEGYEIPYTDKKTSVKAQNLTPEETMQENNKLPDDRFKTTSSQVTSTPESTTTKTTSELQPELRGAIPAINASQMVKNFQHSGWAQNQSDPGKSETLRNIAREGSQFLKNQFPETAPLAKNISTNIEALENIGEPDFIRNVGEGGTKVASDKARNLVENFNDVNNSNARTARKYTMDLLRNADPVYAAKFEPRAKQAALDKAIADESAAKGWTGIGGTTTGYGYKAVNFAGQTQNFIGDKYTKIANLASWPQAKVQALSNSLKGNPHPQAQTLSKMLDGTISGDSNKRGAMLFAISQNKDYRDLLNQHSDDEANK